MVASSPRSPSQIGDSVLTPRESQVLALVAEGLSDSEIGLRLFITANTVKSHLKCISRKFNSRNRTHLVAVAFRSGVLS